MRIIFMGTPEFSVPVLDALVAAGHDIISVYCQPPRPAGRGKKDRLTPVHAHASELGLEVRTPMSLRSEAEQQAFAALEADVAVVVAFGLILPQAILDMPARGCLNIHASLLPRWRGAAPIHRAILSGDSETGVCIMQMEAGLDTGPVLTRAVTPIGPQETTETLHDRLSCLGAEEIVSALARIDTLVPVPQPDEGITYAHKIDKAEAEVNWEQSAGDVDRQIRGLSPFPGAWSLCGDTRIKLLESRLATGQGPPGSVLLDPLRVACGTGAVELLRMQRAGKAAQGPNEFLNGWPLTQGTLMGGKT